MLHLHYNLVQLKSFLFMEKICFFIAVTLLSVNCFALSSNTDEAALLAFKAGIISDPYDIFVDNWMANTSICNWIGVSCSRNWQRVIASGGATLRRVRAYVRTEILGPNNYFYFFFIFLNQQGRWNKNMF